MNDAGYDVEPFEMDLSSRESILAILTLSFWTAMVRCMGRLRSIRQLKELSAIVMTSSSWKVRVRKCSCRTSAAIASVIPLQPGCAKPVRISSSCKISLGIRISRLPWTFMLMWRRSCAKKSWAIWKFISQSKSMGYAKTNLSNETIDDFMNRIDEQMYQDKMKYYEHNDRRNSK